MSRERPDRIVVQAKHEEEVQSDRVEIELVIAGSSFVSGRAALARAKEVREVVESLRQHDIAEDDIALRDVITETQKGVFTDSSSAQYTLRVTCRDLDRFADVLVNCTRPKHTRLAQIDWKYPDDVAAEDRWLTAALERANRRAEVMATALGVRVEGVHEASFVPIDEGPRPTVFAEAMIGSVRAARTREVSDALSMSVEHTKRAGVQVNVAYRVSGRA